MNYEGAVGVWFAERASFTDRRFSSSTGAVGVGFADRAMSSFAYAVPLLVAASCFGAANTACLTSGRIYYVAAREGQQM